MDFWLNLRLKISKFLKKHKKKIAIVAIIWGLVIAVNYFLMNQEIEITPSTTYEPHEPIIDTTDSVPEAYREPINNLIYNFINYCNNKEYENGYNLLSDEYKSKYCSTIEVFKEYVDTLFAEKKIYNIQNFSNVNNVYVYRLRLLEDILASGTTDGYEYQEEKIAIKEENGVLKLALNGYIGEEQLGIIAEDEYMKINIVSKEVSYTSEIYTVEVTNKTENYIVFLDNTEIDEIVLNVDGDSRSIKGLENGNLVALPGANKNMLLGFVKHYDNEADPDSIVFNTIRILPEFTGIRANAEKEKENAVKLYSLTVNLKPQE